LNSSQIEVEGLHTELQRLIHLTSEAELTASRVQDEFEQAAAQVREVEDKLSQDMRELNALRSRMSEAQLKLEQAKMKETYIIDQIRDRYMVELAQVAAQESHEGAPALPLEELELRRSQYGRDVEELRDKLKRIGEVNLTAIQEYDDVQKRYEFLSQQHTDLLDAKENLRKVIDRINRICSRRFKETFEQVNDRFTKVFPVLFGGGEAHLILIDGPEMDDPGIDIVARPPGKKMQNVTLLSGGEKALTAVSLIFSIFLVKPSPFCLLDEVDAPLDDANVYRFNDLVKEMAKRSQIIVVTHNKHTMRVNNKLYGVTMQEKGVSKMVSVSLADAEKLASS
jgi:chromosome segregation protein